jgi:hypothetical protein
MKKLLVPLVVGMMALPATAATMQCMISGIVSWTDGYCEGIEFTMDFQSHPASWRIAGATKPISSVIWSDATAGCAASATSCTKSIAPYQDHLGKATILYSDGTWEAVQASARFETGF